MSAALRAGFRSVARNWGLVVLVLLANLALALVLAVPLSMQLEGDLANRGASSGMMYGFDYDWWAEWSERQEGPSSALSPDILGTGFAFRNLELLLQGALPGGLFARGGRVFLDPTILGVGAVYLLLQVFLTGGLLGVFRSPRGGWTARGLVHGSGFYFGRILRVSLLALAAAGLVFALNAPFARRVDDLAREAVSGRTALALVLGRHALLLLALVFVHMVSSHAKVLVVREERLSAGARLPLEPRLLRPEPLRRSRPVRGGGRRRRRAARPLRRARRAARGRRLEKPARGARSLPGLRGGPDRPPPGPPRLAAGAAGLPGPVRA